MSEVTTAPPESPPVSSDDLDVLVEQIVDSFPRLSQEQRAELSQLLVPREPRGRRDGLWPGMSGTSNRSSACG